MYVFWGGREGTEAGVAKDPRDALERYREAINVLVDYVVDQGYELRFAIEPKPNEPRGDIFLPTVGHALHFITHARPARTWSASTRRSRTRRWPGCRSYHGVGQALWAGKLFHIDLNAQRIGRYDQDFRFGAEDLKEAFLLVRLLERAGYAGPRHFDAHAYRNEDADGVWDFAAGCMRTYLALAERARALRRAARGRRRRSPRPARPSSREPTVDGVEQRGHAEGGGRRARRARRARLRQRAPRPARWSTSCSGSAKGGSATGVFLRGRHHHTSAAAITTSTARGAGLRPTALKTLQGILSP